ncbi:hypothetical protein M430DRAFT_67118 [Amorphotheca resinae ATCC 22711]|jgi:hypothetical protein|uniref:Uncharacterized protein n=1 Tax=Amorphotheca resinae ATCC 22711 TaxID=857342 RepID=A0A2T3B050_AMORE|nr:hypothetical protein M430DRAFT_67118 [Amorphotheca resinae ATCC 22711]PSS16779.1 hypothetical protein M430DRAFT_67118 [Amorphotheca resinae ATCC 22711]
MASSSQDLAATPENQTIVPPAQAQAAQIPLQSFSLPTFPPEAFTAGLGSLILTSDIKLTEYTDLLEKPFSIPELPTSIKSLTLELFSLGYPPGFLTALGKRLPDLKSLTIYSQLFAGTSPASREDALTFLRFQPALQELHLLDVFGSPGLFTDLAKALSPCLRFLEVNYTYRHSDPGFLTSVPSKEVSALVSKELVGLTMSISAPDITDDEDDIEGTEVGIKPVAGQDAREFATRLAEDSEGLVMLDATMFELTPKEVEDILDKHEGIKVLGFTVGLDDSWDEALDMLAKKERGFEVLEIVAVPREGMVEKLKEDPQVQISKGSLDALGQICKELRSIKFSILRTKQELWTKEDGVWEKRT